MVDDDAAPRRPIRSARTYREARALKEILRRLGVPTSEVELRIRGLRLVSPAHGFLVASVLGLALLATSPILGLVCYLVGASTAAVVVACVTYVPLLLALTIWQVRKRSPMGAGYAVPKSVEVTVSPPYAEEANRILATVSADEVVMLSEGTDERNR